MNLESTYRVHGTKSPLARAWRVAVFLAMVAAGAADGRAVEHYGEARREMVQAVERTVVETRRATGIGTLDPRVLRVLGRIPRHEFVPEHLQTRAYENRPLPIGHGQTISQPYIVALMTDLLSVGKDSVVLEVGTGSGYQAAVLGDLVEKVFTIEIIEPLGIQARARLKRLGFGNITVRVADGYYGWKEHAPFDAIIVTAAAGHVPPPLVKQLKPGGIMVIPVGKRFFGAQQLVLVKKGDEGEVTTRQILPVAFVPLTGGH